MNVQDFFGVFRVWKCLKQNKATCKDMLMTMINDLDRLRHWWRRVEVVQVKVCIFEGGCIDETFKRVGNSCCGCIQQECGEYNLITMDGQRQKRCTRLDELWWIEEGWIRDFWPFYMIDRLDIDLKRMEGDR